MLHAFYLFVTVMFCVAYLCFAFKMGFIVLEKTEDTGFHIGFYLMTVIAILALPVCIAAGVTAS